MKKIITTLTALSLGVVTSQAALSIVDDSFTYTQDFNGLASTGTLATSNAWTNNSTLAGWSLFNRNGVAIASYAAGAGALNTGAFYSFGTAAADRALGGTASGGAYFGSPAGGAVAGYIAVAFTNNTGDTLEAITIAFDGEQWRNGGNTTAQSMVLEYGFGDTFGDVASWTAPSGTFDWASPVNTTTGAAVDGNVAGLVAGRGGEIDSLTWATGSTMWFRWIENNDAGNDHGLAIDNFSVSSVTAVAAVPEPSSTALLGLAGLACILRRRR